MKILFSKMILENLDKLYRVGGGGNETHTLPSNIYKNNSRSITDLNIKAQIIKILRRKYRKIGDLRYMKISYIGQRKL